MLEKCDVKKGIKCIIICNVVFFFCCKKFKNIIDRFDLDLYRGFCEEIVMIIVLFIMLKKKFKLCYNVLIVIYI